MRHATCAASADRGGDQRECGRRKHKDIDRDVLAIRRDVPAPSRQELDVVLKLHVKPQLPGALDAAQVRPPPGREVEVAPHPEPRDRRSSPARPRVPDREDAQGAHAR